MGQAHPQVTKDQIDLWLESPVTKALQHSLLHLQEYLDSQVITASEVRTGRTNDEIVGSLWHLKGQQENTAFISNFDYLLGWSGLIKQKEDIKMGVSDEY